MPIALGVLFTNGQFQKELSVGAGAGFPPVGSVLALILKAALRRELLELSSQQSESGGPDQDLISDQRDLRLVVS